MTLILQLTIFGAKPTNTTAFFRSGQVFLTWNEVTSGQKYVIYSSASPITAGDLITANIRHEVIQGSAGSKLLARTTTNNASNLHPTIAWDRMPISAVDPSGPGVSPEVADGVGMIVLTTHQDGAYYYAVTAVVGGIEDKTVDAGNMVGPINEIVEDPAPVLIWQSDSMMARFYLQYLDVDSFNPTIGGIYAWPYWVGVNQNYNSTTDKKPVRLLLGGYDGQAQNLRDKWRYFSEGIEVVPDEQGNWWFGYSQTWAYDTSKLGASNGNAGTPTTGPVINFVEARVMNFMKYLMLVDPYYSSRIDSNRIHILGGSMGGGGGILFAQNYPDFFAFCRLGVPPTNYLEVGVWTYKGNLESKWGAYDDDNMTMAFAGWRSEWLNQKYKGMPVHRFVNSEYIVQGLEGIDMPFINCTSGALDDNVTWPLQGRNYYAQLDSSRRAWGGSVEYNSGHDCCSMSDRWDQPQLWTIRKNNSFPAFSNVAKNPTFPIPDAPTANCIYNLHLIWSTLYYKVGGYQNQVDQTNRYEIVIASYRSNYDSLKGNDTADVTPRRLQNFVVIPGEDYIVKNTAVNDTNQVYQIDTITADTFGLVTYTGFHVMAGNNTSGGSRFIMAPLEPITGIAPTAETSKKRAIQACPNPFNASTVISINGQGHEGPLEFKIYDLKGAVVKTLTATSDRGNYSCVWNGTKFPSNVYFVQVAISDAIVNKKIIMIK
ncbi:MAG: hypothetical protein A2268_14430 [Candidatus Raymondbacteria bacterium RifOxyA12_full_50_37]|uniref:Secretion system C-terminal sorting domain-containing protein n=1 Tax=Candidatus Raymondbacteria bacterium RIFOXYD12_FULL_49_13 TaxID=1817890 RepID=A0A1F7F8Z7_UNCRA|nr:MAG: hypothetical protein A2268_14430 [Candidatus Raymondbacteria bacterium RifOxyA12_full_50_37]OGJ87458.1 MAG: hypothetical protein A2350_13885 [Candidatus Raymondbacteria bacterium RifOxyB12_full_50_8]OGJ88617.1 MAG: hypothetical protein A2248_20365 [Candidatus Raymondbacteria bacterium RIFOXYA2_FULL_49_16]OGK02906.1 MAG: hypothetical protein A2487_17945 [Candidatus Raymondbacteria bacterium RifOxyC12_full_50_8]OGK03144.1 MAG: hypothetical protein A2519_07000 [Candidatus Raymondbacteria b